MFESCFGFPKTFDEAGHHIRVSEGGRVKPRSNCGQCDDLELCMGLSVTYELIEKHPCLGKLCGASTIYSDECLVCCLRERCVQISEMLHYHGVYHCPFCGLVNTQIIVEVKFIVDSFEARVCCRDCECSSEQIPFDGTEQDNIDLFLEIQCKHYPSVYDKLWKANCKSDGTHGKAFYILRECTNTCKPKQVMKCLGSIKFRRNQTIELPKKLTSQHREATVEAPIISECMQYKDFGKFFTPELGEPKTCFLCPKIFECLKKFMESVGADLVSPAEVFVECEQYPVVDDDEGEACEGCSCVEFCEDSFRNEFVHPSNPDNCRYFFEFRYFGNDKVLMAKQCAKCSFKAHCKEKCIIKNEIRTRIIRDAQNFL